LYTNYFKLLIGAAILLSLTIAHNLYSDSGEIGQSLLLQRFFSPIHRTERVVLEAGISSYKLNSQQIVVSSEKVYSDSLKLVKGIDYHLDYQGGRITFLEEKKDFGQIEIEYSVIPEGIQQEFYYFISRDYADSLSTRKRLADRINLGFHDTDLNISGSKTFSVAVGSDEDFNLSQSLFLQIDGELHRNLNIQAQLSDTQSPLTPEGDTRELSSLDQVFIRLYGKQYEVAFGDLEMSFDESQFMDTTLRFEGVKGSYSSDHEFQGAIAIARAKRETNEFRGVDGKQGPYYLTLPGSGGFVQLIAGSEEVFLNGILMGRGSDYTVNYAEGSISFTAKQFIDSNSQIYVRFQYSDDDYRQNLYLNNSSVRITDDLIMSHYVFIRNDDKDNPLQEVFTEEDRLLLKEAGDGEVWADGVIATEEGDGLYVQDIDEEGSLFYRYVGPNEEGNFNVTFSYVGSGNGDYEQIGPNKFEYRGLGQGSWLPLRRLTAPEYLANYDVGLQWERDLYKVTGEGIFTLYDKNTFSDLDSGDNQGYGTHWAIQVDPDLPDFRPELKLYYRFLSKNIATFSDISDVETSYGLSEFTRIDSVATHETGSDFFFRVKDILSSRIRYTHKRGEDLLSQNSIVVNSSLMQQPFLPAVNYRFDYAYQSTDEAVVTGNEEEQSQRELTIRRNSLDAHYTYQSFRLGGDYQVRTYREKSIFYPHTDSLDVNNYSTRWDKKSLYLQTHQTSKVAGNIFITHEDNDFFDHYDEIWQRQRESMTLGGESFIDVYEQRIRAFYSHRLVTSYHGEGQAEDSRFDMAEINVNSSTLNRGVNLSSNYMLKNVEFYPKVRELIFVGQHAGIYDSTGVVSDDGEYDYEMVQVGDPELSIEVNTDLTLNFTPRLFTPAVSDDSPFFLDMLKKMQLETYLLRAENSRSDKKWDVYLLKPELMMNRDTTIYGRFLHRQTFWYDLLPGKLITRLMYQQDSVLDNRYQDEFTTDSNSREAMLRLNRVWASDFELSYSRRVDAESRYNSEVNSTEYALDVRNRPGNQLIINSFLSYINEEGDSDAGGSAYKLESYSIAESVTLSFLRKYRFFSRLEFKHNRRSGSGFLAFLPDKREGNIFKWNLRFNYQLNPYTSIGAEYSGNDYPLQETVHRINIDFRAEF
jgi:hypothetical protein